MESLNGQDGNSKPAFCYPAIDVVW